MNFKKYHVSKNLFDEEYPNIDGTVRYRALNLGNGTYTLSSTVEISQGSVGTLFFLAGNVSSGASTATNAVYKDRPITVTSTDGYVTIAYRTYTTDTPVGKETMLNTGTTALPYEPYSSEVWHDIPHYIHKTDADTITTLPADIYANDTTATVGLKGNMYQASGVSPTNPIQPQECGDLETTGEHAGQYKIPILSASTTTPVYLGEVESTRQIIKSVLKGDDTETYTSSYSGDNRFFNYTLGVRGLNSLISTHFTIADISSTSTDVGMRIVNSATLRIRPVNVSGMTVDTFKAWLAQQYANGTPVTVWYVLATETTGIINEPLRKIGNYADTVSGITIPTIAGANSFDVLTTLKPSEVTVNYKGWHPVQSVHERENGAWT